jgi:hypothetical protein
MCVSLVPAGHRFFVAFFPGYPPQSHEAEDGGMRRNSDQNVLGGADKSLVVGLTGMMGGRAVYFYACGIWFCGYQSWWY